jgi:hypothetical protein
MMPRKVELSRTLTIRGEETDCLVHCEVSLFDDETGRGGEVDITKVEVDGGDDTEIPQADWPERAAQAGRGEGVRGRRRAGRRRLRRLPRAARRRRLRRRPMTRAQPVSDWRALRELMADEPAAPARQVDELPAPMLPPAPVARVAPIEEEGATMPAAGNAGQPPAAEIERRRPDLSEPAAAPVAPAVKKPVPAEVAAVVPKLKPAISGGGGASPSKPSRAPAPRTKRRRRMAKPAPARVRLPRPRRARVTAADRELGQLIAAAFILTVAGLLMGIPEAQLIAGEPPPWDRGGEASSTASTRP